MSGVAPLLGAAIDETMDKDRIAIIGPGVDDLFRLRLSDFEGAEAILTVSDFIEPAPLVMETFELKPIEISPMPFSRKEKSPYRCDGSLKRGRRR